jgi:DNA-binding protein WhiA
MGLSYSSELKTELCKIKPTGCCRIAECYALLLFSRSFCKEDISIRTVNKDTAELYSSLIKLSFGTHTVMKPTESGTSYKVNVTGEADREKIINYYDSGQSDWILNPKFVKRTCCRRSFIRGAFLACGSVNNPEKGYHLEFAVKDPTLAFAFAAFLELCGHKPKHSQRKNVTALYFNDSSAIEELLGEIGAGQKSLELMEIMVVRSMRNKLNRKNNFETANISKTVNASIKQKEAIEFLIKENKLSLLPKELLEVAMLRKENPEASLTELCKLLGGGITRSGLNHRINRIITAAVDLGYKPQI